MIKDFDYYDRVAVFIPGAVVIALGCFVGMEGERIVLEKLLNISIGSSLLIIISIFVAGEIIQLLGKMLENTVWCIHGGQPTEWISSEESSWFVCMIRTGHRSQKHALIGEPEVAAIRSYVKKHSGNTQNSDFRKCFSSIQNKVNKDSTQKVLIEKMLAKANMARAFVVILALTSAYYFYTASLPAAFSLLALSLLMLLRYIYYSKIYAQKLYAAFLSYLEEKEAEKRPPRRAIGVFD